MSIRRSTCLKCFTFFYAPRKFYKVKRKNGGNVPTENPRIRKAIWINDDTMKSVTFFFSFQLYSFLVRWNCDRRNYCEFIMGAHGTYRRSIYSLIRVNYYVFTWLVVVRHGLFFPPSLWLLATIVWVDSPFRQGKIVQSYGSWIPYFSRNNKKK